MVSQPERNAMKARAVQGPPHRLFLTGRAGQEFEVEDVITYWIAGDVNSIGKMTIELQYEPIISEAPAESSQSPASIPPQTE